MEVNMEMTEVNVYTFIYKVVCCNKEDKNKDYE